MYANVTMIALCRPQPLYEDKIDYIQLRFELIWISQRTNFTKVVNIILCQMPTLNVARSQRDYELRLVQIIAQFRHI